MNSNHKSSGGRQARKGSSPQRKNSFRKDFKKPLSTPKKVDIGGIRLNKFISNSGICSRREADTYIEHGSVTVNGNLVTEMGYKVQPNDDVRFDGTSISPEKKKYVLGTLSFSFRVLDRYIIVDNKDQIKEGIEVEYLNNNKWSKKIVENVDLEWTKLYSLLSKYKKLRIKQNLD